MIIGIGVDSVAIKRFENWHTYPSQKLARIFSTSEITYCCSNMLLASQRFAVRFAAREALFKALSQALPGHSIPLFTLCRAVTVIKQSGVPCLQIDWTLIIPYISPAQRWDAASQPRILLSLTHTKDIATAFVILEKDFI
jgi:phosphopantetheine--protein transferase-like protein